MDLWQLGFMFAIEDLDPKIGHISASYTRWNQDEGRIEKQIKMVSCSQLMEGGMYYQRTNNKAFRVDNLLKGRKDSAFLCPVELDSLELQGNFGADNFNFVKMRLHGCDNSNIDVECASDLEVSQTTFNFAMLSAIPNILAADHTEIVSYSADLTHFYYLDPTHALDVNVFFLESTINLKDNVWDFFEYSEKDV